MPQPVPISRRAALTAVGVGLAAAAADPLARRAATAAPAPALMPAAPGSVTRPPAASRSRRLPADLFRLGVASGDPLPDGVVLWTRLAPRPLDGGGMPDRDVPVRWEVADDPAFRRVRARGTTAARPERAHSVHVDLRGLDAGREYFYRFGAGGEISPVGRTGTAPARGSSPRRLRFAFASCQNYQDGYFTALRHLAEEPDVAFVAFLGDYIYESAPDRRKVRVHEGTGEPTTLAGYRNRYGQYRSDPDLQAAHAAFPWVVTFDDHEVDNNWAGWQDAGTPDPAAFRARRAAAFAAYYEHMPLRPGSVPHGPWMRVYRRLCFGDLAAVHVLDTRQYRSRQPSTLEQANDPARTMTGAAQERWLTCGMATSGARWNLLANQVMWAQNDRLAGPAQQFDFDCWDGYRVQRRRLLEFFGSGATRNPVVLTGDRHRTWVCDLKPDFDDPCSPVVGAEITGTSLASGGDEDPVLFHRMYDPVMRESPHWKYIDNRRGYVVCDLSRDRLAAAVRTVDNGRSPDGSTVTTAARFTVRDGCPGVTVENDAPPVAVV